MEGQFYGHFPIIPLKNSMVKSLGATTWPCLFSNQCYKEVCYKGTVFTMLSLV